MVLKINEGFEPQHDLATFSHLKPHLFFLESYKPEQNPRSFRFEDPAGVIVAETQTEVLIALRQAERAVQSGCHVAGFVSYEAAVGLDPAMRVMPATDLKLPLIWFGVFRRRVEIQAGATGKDDPFALSPWEPAITEEEYQKTIACLREHIAAGETYQVNFTHRLRASFEGSPLGFYRALCRTQRAGYCAYLDLGRYQIVSASPELFFRVEDRKIVSRPMKGTRRRGLWWDQDQARVRELRSSPKDLAENVMIVDLIRNDLGRVAETGSVNVPQLFEIERYETLLQMTSTVEARLRENVGPVDVFQALFPCGSITGAPKIETMKIIDAIEPEPRGVYTGSIGYISPSDSGGWEAMFNVAIRTALIDRESQAVECGVGGGITYDSQAESEWEECLLKRRFLTRTWPEFRLLETLLYEPEAGYFLLDYHLKRMEASARYFGFRWDQEVIRESLLESARLWKHPQRVRLLVSRDGANEMQVYDFKRSESPQKPLLVDFSDAPVDSKDPFLYHKTTHRLMYESRKDARPDLDDVILLNEDGEVTESSRANVVVEIEGQRFTPPRACGLLGGTFRESLLAKQEIAERVLRPEDLRGAGAVFLINSVQRWMQSSLIS